MEKRKAARSGGRIGGMMLAVVMAAFLFAGCTAAWSRRRGYVH